MKNCFLTFVAAAGCLAGQGQPSADTFKQVLTLKLQSLLPGGMTERNVLFQNVQAGAGTPGFYPFTATMDIRDYGPGYPRNRFYGTTCVNRLSGEYMMFVGQSGQWTVEGRLTPPLETQKCQNNPSAGISAIPLSSLSGSAAAGAPAAPPAAASAVGAGGASMGSYECWANGQARMLMNFQIRSGNGYTGSDGKPGSYSVDARGNIAFRGGALDGVMPAGFTSVYYSPGGRPTVSFRGPSGSEAVFCQRVR